MTRVHNPLEVVLPEEDNGDDAMLTNAANIALTLNVTVPEGVEASARNGTLRLIGTVHYGVERAAAERAVAGVTGVRNIKDEIKIALDADPVDVTFDGDADPVDITVHVQDALERYALIADDSEVVVTTNDDTVTLSGHVRTWPEHDAVVGAAWMAPGVFDVRDDLFVTG